MDVSRSGVLGFFELLVRCVGPGWTYGLVFDTHFFGFFCVARDWGLSVLLFCCMRDCGFCLINVV
jgi:hypothetical protein